MFGRLIVAIGWLATLVFVANGAVGYFGGRGLWVQRLHLMGGLAATMLLVFAHTWLVVYLVGVGRLLREEGREAQADRLLPGLRMAGFVVLLSAGNFVLGVMRLAGDFETWIHSSVVWVCFMAQILALLLEWKAVGVATAGISAARSAASGRVHG